MRSIWTGSISFGLVNIPINLYSAIEHKKTSFKLLHKKDNSPIKYRRVCDKEGKEVEYSEIVKGLKISKDNFIVFTAEELKKFKPTKSDLIEIVEFVDHSVIDPILINSHYYIAPQKQKEKSFFLFKNVLQSTGKVAVGRFVMREKKYTCVISSYKKGLLLTTLTYSYEIRNMDDIEELKNPAALKQEELNLAKNLINQLYNESFDVTKYKDSFEVELRKSLKTKSKVTSQKTKLKHEPDLIKALRKSLK